MSAQPITTDDLVAAAPARPKLGVVPPTPGATVSTMGFVGIILGLIAVGMAGVMIVTTNVGAQSRELAGLRREATELSYTSAALESHIQRMSSANALALRASELGMVPNPYPAFINLADGSVTGYPKAATQDEMPFLRGIATKPLPKPVVPTTRPAQPADTGADSDLVAAGATGGQP
ncbi:septum formation initiator family protein [Tessaracoccus lubricantis]|uniref:Septum formation initiator family protein n=1 Tax=Tessaracoccus lubricantis TaxID=545543 RepID=A0ABP9FHW7_9ACTN